MTAMLPARTTVARTLIWGEISTLEAPKIRSGNVSSEPELKNVMMKSSIDRANDSRAAARMPGVMSGSVTRLKVRHGVAPRSMAASSSDQSNPRMRALTVRATNEVQNSTWAITMVVKPRCTPLSMNRVANDDPSTISGVVMGSTRSRLMRAPPLKR